MANNNNNKQKPKKKFIKTIGGIILYLVLVLALVYFLPKALSLALNTEYPMAAITSGSMWPELKKGDLVFIQGIDPKTIQVNDIIVYANDPSTGSGQGGFTIHRVIELKEDTLITKGDANNIADKPVKYEDIIGRLLKISNWQARLPKLGYISITVNK